MGERVLGEFEHQVLLAILREGSESYSVEIVVELERRTEREVATAAVYVALTRLFNIDLTSADNLGDLVDLINDAAGTLVTASLGDAEAKECADEGEGEKPHELAGQLHQRSPWFVRVRLHPVRGL